VSTSPTAAGSPENVPIRLGPLLIVRLGAMGDVIHGLPAIAALRQTFPAARLGWLIEERWAELLCTLAAPRSGPRSLQRPLLDRVHTIDTKQWRAAPLSVSTWERIAAGLSDVRSGQYEIAVDLQGALRSALLARWSGAPLVYGAAQPRENPASMFYTRQVITNGGHVVRQNLRLVEAIAQRPLLLPQVEFPRDDAAAQEIDRWLSDRDIQSFALLNPGAGWGAKQWPAERYGHVVRKLAEDGVKSVVNSGPGEQHLAGALGGAAAGTAQSFDGSLAQLIALTRRARLYIGGDTGPMHLAAALRVPVVGVFGPTDPARNGPFGTRNIVLRSPASTTSYRHLARMDEGLLDISPEQVVAAARQLLQERHG
jgi:heptosyltransferase-1